MTRAWSIALLLAAAACADLSFTTAVNRIEQPLANPSFRDDIAPLLAATCASSGACHAGPTPQQGLNLEPGSAWAALVNVAPQFPTGAAPYLVRPGFPDSSFFYRVLSPDVNVRLGFPSRMPLTSTPLPAPVVQTIANWIANGAPNN